MEFERHFPLVIVAVILTLMLSFCIFRAVNLKVRSVPIVQVEDWLNHLANWGLVYPAIFVYILFALIEFL